MSAQSDFLLYVLQKYQNQIVIAYFCLAALSWKYWLKARLFFMSAMLICTAALLAVPAIAAYAFTIILYLVYPNYFDHVQPTVASISWLWMQGKDLYANWTTADVYGLAYGPILFLINGTALLSSPTIFASKVPGILSLGAALGATWIILKRKTESSLASMFLLISLVMLFVPFGVYAYWNRPEPFLTFVSVLALVVAIRPPSLVGGVGIGVLAGLAAGLKLYGFIYIIPAALAALARVERGRSRLVMAIVGSASAVALLPYIVKGASLPGFFRFISVEIHHGWSVSAFFENLRYAFVLIAPIIGIWILWKPAVNSAERWLLAGLCIAVAMVTVIGGKVGGGAYYLLPLVPICIYGIAVVLTSSEIEINEIAALIFIFLFLAYGPRLFVHMRAVQHSYQVAVKSEPQKIAELITYLDYYPEAQIGISDGMHYSSYFYRILSVLKGRPLHVDFSTWMELAYVGVDEQHIVRFIKECYVRTWIIPLGMPFTMVNKYTHLPMLSEGFRQTFSTNYLQIQVGQTYQVWACKSQAQQ